MKESTISLTLSAEQNNNGLVVYDGFCVLCSGTVRFLLKIDRKNRLKFTTISQANSETASNVSAGFVAQSTVLFVKDNRVYTESEAILHIFNHLGGLWKLVNLLKIIPQKARDTLYRFIARHRYTIFGKKKQCDVPSANYAHRFLPPIKTDDLLW